jgi:membrane fusion protein (multidrug efflux system)
MRRLALPFVVALLLAGAPARAQFGPSGPPSVGVVTAQKRDVTESHEFVGRIQATDKVDIVARVTAQIVERPFTEGGEVAKGDLLYRLEPAPFEADLAAKQATVAQMQALLRNATLVANRAQSLLGGPAGQRSTYDEAVAQQGNYAAQLKAAEAQVRMSQINLDYTEIHAPIAGKIGRTALAVGNLATPTAGPLVSIVSQDPMYVVFPVPSRTALELRNTYIPKGGFAAVAVKVRLADGSIYGQTGKLDYADPSIAPGTDTILLRASIPNPLRPGAKPNEPGNRDLVDGAFVTVLVEGVEPVQAMAIPRAAVMQDQQGSFVYVVDGEKKVVQRRVTLGRNQGTLAVITEGLKDGETVIAEGLQRVRPGVVVNPSPATPPPAAGAKSEG